MVTGEILKPRHLWEGPRGARLPVFLDQSSPQPTGRRLGIGRSRRTVSQALGWLRAGNDRLALVTNGRQWRLLFAGLDYDAWCEWDLDLWFEEGAASPQVAALRTLLHAQAWTPGKEDEPSPLLQAIRDTRKGQAELSEVLGERVRESVEILIREHGHALQALTDESKVDVSDYRRSLADDTGLRLGEVSSEDEIDDVAPSGASPEDIYRAACRVAMRLVVILFAESRDLLPRDNTLYHESYGLNGLLEELDRNAARGSPLTESFGAWPRVLALFTLVRDGSHHPDLPVTQYGGELFAPGDLDSEDGLSRALSVYESACFDGEVLPDLGVHQMLRLLTRTTVRIRQGRGYRLTVAPVDFSDLSSEYIGILYEGLLDYELKTAPPDDPVVFVAAGDQPALPLSRLEAMDDRALKALFENLKDSSSSAELKKVPESVDPGDPEAGDTEGALALAVEDAHAEYEVEVDSSSKADAESPSAPDAHRQQRLRAELWARRAVQAASLIRKQRGKQTPARRRDFEQRLVIRARQLITRIVLPREWYLVRWGGTRKGSGSFYTRPGLAVPTVQRTLRPLAFDPPPGADGAPDPDARSERWTPKTPERILSLAVCDPACGSGTFPLAALRFLTDALYVSLQHHDRIEGTGERSLVRLLGINGRETPDDRLSEELIPCPPDDDNFEARLRAVLRRHVVERCIYAVDLDPLAVELCRLSLWIETMDRTLPFGFLDHKVKCGNALIGTWLDQFLHYPAMAWKNREGGDKNHSNGVHFQQNARTKAIKAFVKDKLTPDLRLFLQGPDLLQEDLLQDSLSAHQDALDSLTQMHSLPVQDAAERARLYRELLDTAGWRSLKDGMNLWCACWFWPADETDTAPLPSNFADPPDHTRQVATRIASQLRFFHWELEFPDVYQEAGSGFDAVLGNPPWENLQPNPEEFFSNADPLFRTYGRSAKNSLRRAAFKASPSYERSWLDYTASFRYISNWIQMRAHPFGDPAFPDKDTFSLGPGSRKLHDRWRSGRRHSRQRLSRDVPFRHQMGRVFTYQLFLEQSLAILRERGRCGLIVPAGICSDAWSRPLRDHLLDACQWEWLFGIENREGIFPIHRSQKFNPIVVQKGGTTRAIRTAFMRRTMDDWEHAEDLTILYPRAHIEHFSPKSRAILEIQSEQDLELLEKIYSNAVLLGEASPGGWDMKPKLEFMMNTDTHLFPPRPQWEANGYRPDEYSRWLLGDWRPIEELWEELKVDPSNPEPVEVRLDHELFHTTGTLDHEKTEPQFKNRRLLRPGDVARTDWQLRCAEPPYDNLPIPRSAIPAGTILSLEGDSWIRVADIRNVALPLYEGRMIGQFDSSRKGWVGGKGRAAVWQEIPWNRKRIEPQFLMSSTAYADAIASPSRPKVSYMRVASSTNSRTAIATLLWGVPTGDTAATLSSENLATTVLLTAVFNSLVFDFVTRLRMTGLHLDLHVVEQNPVPVSSDRPEFRALIELAVQLNFESKWFAPKKLEIVGPNGGTGLGLHTDLALLPAARSRSLAVLNALIASIFGLNYSDLLRVTRDCDLPTEALQPKSTGTLDTKGFWRADRHIDPELRHAVLTLVAFHDLEQKIELFDGDRDKGIGAFLSQNHGEGWLLPETLCLADYDLGHDERAQHPQPVASRLGPRFYDWQLTQSPEESWKECHLHARNLLGSDAYASLLVDLMADTSGTDEGRFTALTDQFKRDLLGDEGYIEVLIDLRARNLLYDHAYWNGVEDLRRQGHLEDELYDQLVSSLDRRGLLDDHGPVGFREDERRLRAADGTADYRAENPTEDGQRGLFE